MFKLRIPGKLTFDKSSIRESALSVLPVIIIVAIACFTILPVSADLMLSFLLGSLFVIVGMGLFSLGSESAMTPIGSHIGSSLTKTRNLPLILIISFFLGAAVTVAEPDLQVLANTVPHIDTTVLIITVGVGVGIFLTVSMLRIITGLRLRWLFLAFYGLIFILAAFTDKSFLSIAFDSGGVTTGPMTVPFILAFGVGISNIRSDRKAASDSFGLVALCSIGPIIAVLVLGFIYDGSSGSFALPYSSWDNTVALGSDYIRSIPTYMLEIAMSLAPIFVLFMVFQIFNLKLPKESLSKIFVGIIFTYVGLVLFLTGVNVGFSGLGTVMGKELATGRTRKLLVPVSMLLGWFIISAEPAVVVLEKQIEDVSAGAIPGKAVKLSLSIAISLAMGLAMFRVISGINILWFVIPGYAAALALSFFVPDIYTAIAFDSGGVASGPMTATFMLQFMIGASSALGGNILTDAFGLVALVAMMPLLSVQIMGFIYGRKGVTDAEKEHITDVESTAHPLPVFDDTDVIELWEV